MHWGRESFFVGQEGEEEEGKSVAIIHHEGGGGGVDLKGGDRRGGEGDLRSFVRESKTRRRRERGRRRRESVHGAVKENGGNGNGLPSLQLRRRRNGIRL